MKFDRQEYIHLITFGEVKRQMFCELFGPLIGLEEEWRKQGASEDEIKLTGFDFDFVKTVHCGGNTGIMGGFEPRVIEETNEHIISIDSLGRKNKLCKGYATISLPMEYPVKDMESWLKIKHLFEFSEYRLNWENVEKAKKEQKDGALVIADIPGGFDLPRQLMGEEAVCYCFYDNPELIKDILETAGRTSRMVLDRISEKILIDNLFVHEDMAGKTGPLIGPNLIYDFIKPYYLEIWKMLESKGTKIFSQDSDGNMNAVIDAFIDCGVNMMFPAEPAASMDIVKIRQKYGNRLALKGGIDKHVLRQDKDAIRKELEYKMLSNNMDRGVVFGLDHRIPNGTPIENYRFYVENAKEILKIPSVGKNEGWARMAF